MLLNGLPQDWDKSRLTRDNTEHGLKVRDDTVITQKVEKKSPRLKLTRDEKSNQKAEKYKEMQDRELSSEEVEVEEVEEETAVEPDTVIISVAELFCSPGVGATWCFLLAADSLPAQKHLSSFNLHMKFHHPYCITNFHN